MATQSWMDLADVAQRLVGMTVGRAEAERTLWVPAAPSVNLTPRGRPTVAVMSPETYLSLHADEMAAPLSAGHDRRISEWATRRQREWAERRAREEDAAGR